MSDFSMFLKENVSPVEDIEYVASNRFKDADGNPVKWILRPVATKVEKRIKDACTIVNKKTGERDFDLWKYQIKICAEAVVYPNLKNAELQDAYGVRGDDELLMELLSISGEFNDLLTKVNEINSPETMDELIDEAKN